MAQRLRAAAEAAKKALSSSTSTTVHLDALTPGADLDLEVSRGQFEELCDDLFKLCVASAEGVLRCDAAVVDRLLLCTYSYSTSTTIFYIASSILEIYSGYQIFACI